MSTCTDKCYSNGASRAMIKDAEALCNAVNGKFHIFEHSEQIWHFSKVNLSDFIVSKKMYFQPMPPGTGRLTFYYYFRSRI